MKTKSIHNELLAEIKNQGVDFVHFVDISHLSEEQNKAYSTAILFGSKLSVDYLRKVAANPDYVEQMKLNNTTKTDEFYLTELKTDKTADFIESYIQSIGFKAYSQSEENISKTGYYDNKNWKTPLPHKTIAGLAGLGWIGKHNLLVTEKYGSAISMCSVLTDAPLKTTRHAPATPKCGDCAICEEICKPSAIKGEIWECGIAREKIVDVFQCTTCFQCLVQCPWTKRYFNGTGKVPAGNTQ